MKKSALISAVLAVAAAIGCIIYGAIYEQYADWMVVLSLFAGAALLVWFATGRQFTYWAGLLGVAAAGFATGLFLTNSYNVWADTWGNIQQYGNIVGEFNFFNSQGGPIPAAIVLIVCFVALILGIISCFTGRKEAQV